MVKTTFNFAGHFDAAKMARAFSSNVPISLKYSLEISRRIKGKNIAEAEIILQKIADMETHLPLQIYTKKIPHRKGNAQVGTKSGRYPVRTCKQWLQLLRSVKANADYKGLNVKKLRIVHATANMGFSRVTNQSQGRISGKSRNSKSAHIEIIVREDAA